MKGAEGKLFLKFKKKENGRTSLAHQHFQLPLQVLPPHYQDEDGTAFVYLLNPSGGILQYDVLTTEILVEEDAKVFVTTPSANKFYGMDEGSAKVYNFLKVADKGVLEYMPEHSVPFANSKSSQETEVYLEEQATLIMNEMFTSGRFARGESFDFESFATKIKIYVKEKLILFDNMVIEPGKLGNKVDLKALGMYEGNTIVSSFYVYCKGMNPELCKDIKEYLKGRDSIRGGASLVSQDLLVVRLLGKSIIDLQESNWHIWDLIRQSLLQKAGVRVRKY